MHEQGPLRFRLREESSNTSNVSYMIKGGLADRCNLFLEVYLLVHGKPHMIYRRAALLLKTLSDPNIKVSNCGLGRCCEEITVSSVLSLFSFNLSGCHPFTKIIHIMIE